MTARGNPRRVGVQSRQVVAERLSCEGGCGGTVRPWWTFDLRCWTQLNFAPDGLKSRLSVPDGVSPRTHDDPAYLRAVKQAKRYLAEQRVRAEAAR